jgi:hypothetical protein
MRKIVHKLINYRSDEINVVAQVNAAISTGEGGVSSATSYSTSRIVQRSGRTRSNPGPGQPTEKEVNDGEAKA